MKKSRDKNKKKEIIKTRILVCYSTHDVIFNNLDRNTARKNYVSLYEIL